MLPSETSLLYFSTCTTKIIGHKDRFCFATKMFIMLWENGRIIHFRKQSGIVCIYFLEVIKSNRKKNCMSKLFYMDKESNDIINVKLIKEKCIIIQQKYNFGHYIEL